MSVLVIYSGNLSRWIFGLHDVTFFQLWWLIMNTFCIATLVSIDRENYGCKHICWLVNKQTFESGFIILAQMKLKLDVCVNPFNHHLPWLTFKVGLGTWLADSSEPNFLECWWWWQCSNISIAWNPNFGTFQNVAGDDNNVQTAQWKMDCPSLGVC